MDLYTTGPRCVTEKSPRFLPLPRDNGDKHGTAEIDDERAADRYYRSGVALLENGDASGALASLKKAQQNCPVSRRAAVAKITKKIDDARDVLWNETQTQAATHVPAAPPASPNRLACFPPTPLSSLRRPHL